MILKGFIIISIVLNLQINIITSRKAFNLDEINSITEYVKNMELKTFDDYCWNSSMINKTHYDVLKVIFNDGINVLSDLEEVFNNSNFNNFDSKNDDFSELMSFYEANLNHVSEVYVLLNTKIKVENFYKKGELLTKIFKYIIETDADNMDLFCRGVLKTSKYILGCLNYENGINEYVAIIKALRKIADLLLMNNKKPAQFNGHGKLMSFRQVLFNYQKRLLFKQVKYTIINYYMWIIEQQCKNTSYTGSINKARSYSMKLQDIMNLTVETLRGINYPAYHREPKHYGRSSENIFIELERMIQTIIINEQDLSLTRTCDSKCNLEQLVDSINNAADCQKFLDCKEMALDYEVCQLDNNVRRYEWFEDGNGKTYGNKGDACHGNMTLLSSYFLILYLDFCSYCVCTCKSKPKRASNVITSISLRGQESDISNNKVVTGLRFVKKDYMIHVQILEAEVLPYGKTNSSSWKPIENFDYNETTAKYYLINDDKSLTELQLGIDNASPESMYLDDKMCPEGEVITGVRFGFTGNSLEISDSTEGFIEIQIRTTPFDFIQGKLVNISETRWLIPEKQSVGDELLLKNPGNPRNSPITDSVLTTNKYVKFRASDMKKDAGQTTVPLLDSRAVFFDKGCPLGGVGIFHSGHEESGGYVAPRVFDFDMY